LGDRLSCVIDELKTKIISKPGKKSESSVFISDEQTMNNRLVLDLNRGIMHRRGLTG
jgi:hypothetical protein